MAALSDYLESGLLTHIFKGTSFAKPTQIAIALTSGVPVESDTGFTIPELASGVSRGANFVTTNYSRINLGNPSTAGNTTWNNVGIDNTTVYTVSGTSATGVTVGLKGYYYPLYLNIDTAKSADTNTLAQSYKFVEYPGTTFYAPLSLQQSGMATNPGYATYQGNGFIKNSTQVIFPTALTDWGWVSGIAIVDTSNYASGNLLMYAKLDNPRYVYTGDNIKFDSNSLEISLN
jgi:hypothetical protein